MDNLENNLSNLPKFQLSKKADFKIKFKIRSFLLLENLRKLSQTIFYPHSLFAKVSVTILMLMIVLGGTAVYAVNNDHITPGNTFYPLKKTVENVEQQLSLTKSAKINTLNKQSERRLKEALNLAQDDLGNNITETAIVASDNIQQTIEEAVNNLDEVIQTSQKIENSDKNKDNIKKKNQAMIEYLDSIDNIAKQNQDKEVLSKVNKARQKIDKYNQILDEEAGEDSVIKNQNHQNKGNKEKENIDRRDRDNTNNDSPNNPRESEQDFNQDKNNGD